MRRGGEEVAPLSGFVSANAWRSVASTLEEEGGSKASAARIGGEGDLSWLTFVERGWRGAAARKEATAGPWLA